MSLSDNHYFALFGLDVAFDIDKNKLKATLLELQKKHHPDASADNQCKTAAEKNASLINHAYNILNRDDERALYLLSLNRQDVNLDNSISDLDFLDEMIELRMALDDSDNAHEIKTIEQSVLTMMTNFAHHFKIAYDDKAWKVATDNAQKLKFLGKLHDDILAKYTDILNTQHNDDDLYV